MIAFLLALAAQNDPLPSAPEGWKVELVAKAPVLRHPTVVCCAPDGRVFVGEDPMDISAPAHATQGRVLCFHPDGKVTVFAENLHAPFGMQYLEGKLYVLHNPKYSRFTDDNGIGRDRVDLIETTNPKPWDREWNDHVPANFKLAMDGYFYMAVGDKGVYGAVGTDGSKAELRGGGILRLRPDARELEIYSTGVRNILDVAINPEDEVFTYDNTDEHHWWARFTHMVEGGYYGYPWDFHPRRPYTLWMMNDYGSGAATNILSYEEDALPEEYRGAFFLADFGKRSVARAHVTRAGATYKDVSRVDFLKNGGPNDDFRPVGICLSSDGMSFYVSCWHHKDSKANVAAGRLFKVTYTGKCLATAKPAWLLPASMGRPFEASTVELVAALSHPARSVRLVAQRRLSDRKACPDLETLLSDRRAPSLARAHALWALDAIDGAAAARPAILKIALEADPLLRRQALRQLGTRRAKVTDLFGACLKDRDAAMRFHAATALGRGGDPAAVPALLEALDESDLFARFAVWTALQRIGRADPSTWSAIARGLESPKPAIREGTLFAMREVYEEPVVALLASLVRDARQPADVRGAALRLLAGLGRKLPPWKGEWWPSPYHPAMSPPLERTQTWGGTPAVLSALVDGLEDADPLLRLASVEALREIKETAAAAKLRERFAREGDLEVKRALLRTLGAFKDKGARELVQGALGDPALAADAVGAAEQLGARDLLLTFLAAPPSTREALAATFDAVGRLKMKDAVPLLCSHLKGESRVSAIAALGSIGGEPAADAVLPLLEDPDANVRKPAVMALGRIKNKKAIPALLAAFGREETQAEAAAALARMPDLRALDAYLYGLAAPSQPLRQACLKALEPIAKEALPLIEARAARGSLPAPAIEELRNLYSDVKKGPLVEARARIPDAAAYLEFALKNAGDPARGRKLFTEPKALACLKCHKVAGEGGEVGPDLSGIGLQFGRKDLAESVLYPSRKVREGYGLVIVRTRGGDILTGVLRGETGDELVLQDAEGFRHRLRKEDLDQRKMSDLSMMPEGLQAALSMQELADLLSYLESLKEKPR